MTARDRSSAGAPSTEPASDRFVTAAIKVVVEINGDQRLLGHRAMVFPPDAHSADLAKEFLTAWDEVKEHSERTLRLYGAEGVLDNIRAEAGS